MATTTTNHNPGFQAVETKKGTRGFIGGDRKKSERQVGLRLYADQEDRFNQLCKEMGLTRVEMMRHLVDLYLGSDHDSQNSAA